MNWNFKILVFVILFFGTIKNANSQGCSGFNFKKESEIASACAGIAMTMMHDANGKAYLYVANKEAGLKIYDISTVASPSLVKTIPITSLGNMDVMNLTQSGNFLYLALGNHFNTNQNAGMAIIDVTKPAEASVTDYWELASSGGGAGVIKVDGIYAYLGAMKYGLMILNIVEKNNIQLVSKFVPDINYPTKNPNPDLYNARGMEVKNNIVYLCYDAGGIRIINVTDKTKPKETGHYSNPALNGKPRAYNNLVLDDSLLYIAVDYCGLEVLNVKDTASIKLRGRWNPYNCPTNNWFTSPVHANEIQYNKDCKTLFVSTGKSDMMVLDISNPTKPDSCNFYGGVANDMGTWGVGLYQNQIYLSYICSIIPFSSNWTGVKILTYTPCKASTKKYVNPGIDLYPNPSKNRLTIQSGFDLTKSKILITNSVGQFVNSDVSFISANQISLDLTSYSEGIYFINFSHEGKSYSSKFIKK
ncbi:MAG: T9SS type A sorting domain-containing protein [Bacteroidia bacterium]